MNPRIAIAIAIGAFSSCASLRAPSGPSMPPIVTPATTTSLVAVEGRPAGVVLRLQSSHERLGSVELYRVVADGEPVLLQKLAADAVLAESLRQGLEIVDSTVVSGQRFAYQLFAIAADDAVLERSEVVDVAWQAPPARPIEVVASALFVDAVEITWRRHPTHGAVVFRRDVLTDGRFERVASVHSPANAWVDRDVVAGGVWSYRVAFALEQDSGLVQFGTPSEEVYASTPEPR